MRKVWRKASIVVSLFGEIPTVENSASFNLKSCNLTKSELFQGCAPRMLWDVSEQLVFLNICEELPLKCAPIYVLSCAVSDLFEK